MERTLSEMEEKKELLIKINQFYIRISRTSCNLSLIINKREEKPVFFRQANLLHIREKQKKSTKN